MERSIQEIYSSIAHAHEGDLEDRRRRYRAIAELVRPGEVVVDIGCGDGIFLELVRERGARAIGVDADPQKVERAREKGFEVHCARAQDLVWSWGEIDLVSMIHIVEHLPPSEVLSMFATARQSLGPSGRAFVLTPNISHPLVQSRFWLDISHTRPYPAELLATIASEIGFQTAQWGQTGSGMDAWCYAFSRKADRVGEVKLPRRDSPRKRELLHTRLFVDGTRDAASSAARPES